MDEGADFISALLESLRKHTILASFVEFNIFYVGFVTYLDILI